MNSANSFAQEDDSAPIVGELSEKAPLIDQIKVEYHVPYIEVFAWGKVPLDCFNKKQIDISIKDDATYIVPRYIFSPEDMRCVQAPKDFEREKIADLDPSNPASFNVAVLGNRGWHWYRLERGGPTQ